MDDDKTPEVEAPEGEATEEVAEEAPKEGDEDANEGGDAE